MVWLAMRSLGGCQVDGIFEDVSLVLNLTGVPRGDVSQERSVFYRGFGLAVDKALGKEFPRLSQMLPELAK